MARGRDFIDQHPITNSMRSFAGVLEDARSDEEERVPIEVVVWGEKVHRFVQVRLDALDPQLVSAPQLEGISRSVDGLVSELKRAVAGEITLGKEATENRFDEILDATAYLPAPTFDGDFDAEAQRLLADVEGKVASEAQAASDAISAAREAGETAVTKLATDLRALRAELEAAESEFKAERAADTQRRDTADAAFTTAEADRAREWERLVADLKEERRSGVQEERMKARSALGEVETRASTTASKMEERAVELLDQLEQLKASAERTVGAIGEKGQTLGLREWHVSERDEANRMRDGAIWVGVGAAVVLFVVLVIRLFVDTDAPLSLAVTVGFVSVVVAAGAVFGFMVQESKQHRINSTRARQLEIEIASLPTYIANLPLDVQEEILTIYTAAFFGHANRPADDTKRGPAFSTGEAITAALSKVWARRDDQSGGTD